MPVLSLLQHAWNAINRSMQISKSYLMAHVKISNSYLMADVKREAWQPQHFPDYSQRISDNWQIVCYFAPFFFEILLSEQLCSCTRMVWLLAMVKVFDFNKGWVELLVPLTHLYSDENGKNCLRGKSWLMESRHGVESSEKGKSSDGDDSDDGWSPTGYGVFWEG